MSVIYSGHEILTYPDFIDLATGKTLVCEPGVTYDLLPDSVPTDGRFTKVIPEKTVVKDIPVVENSTTDLPTEN